MPYHLQLADRIRKYLVQFSDLQIEEKKMFGGLAFIINGKMWVNASGENLMCRFDPHLSADITKRKGYIPMIMKGKEYQGYCYVKPEGFKSKKDFEWWLKLCMDFNEKAKASGKKK
jgi:hypothetical protein